MVFRVRKVIRGRPYLYDVRAYREEGKVKQEWTYIGPDTREGRQEVSHEAMGELAPALLRLDATSQEIAEAAKRHGLRLSRREPEIIAIEHHRRRRKLYVRFR